MSAHTCLPTSPPFGAAHQAPGAARSPLPSVAKAPSAIRPEPAAALSAEAQPSRAGGFLGRLWRAYRQRRADAVLRNLAHEMDAHMLKDVGAPAWLVNESTHEQSLKRITHIDNLRW